MSTLKNRHERLAPKASPLTPPRYFPLHIGERAGVRDRLPSLLTGKGWGWGLLLITIITIITSESTGDSATAGLTTASWQYSRDGETQRGWIIFKMMTQRRG